MDLMPEVENTITWRNYMAALHLCNSITTPWHRMMVPVKYLGTLCAGSRITLVEHRIEEPCFSCQILSPFHVTDIMFSKQKYKMNGSWLMVPRYTKLKIQHGEFLSTWSKMDVCKTRTGKY